MGEKTPEEEYINEFAKLRTEKFKNKMRKNVSEVYDVLKEVHEACKDKESGSLPDELKISLREHFRDMFWSLKFHLKFHGVLEEQLREMGDWELVCLSADEREKNPDEKNVIDPGSKILQILSDITHGEDTPKGSSKHAKDVLTKAKDILSSLPRVFRAKALAVVSHRGKSFVGASIAVSHILRPIYLHNRIANFKSPRLREAVILHQPLKTGDKQGWESEAMDTKGKPKPACTNCRNTFEELEGFIPKTENQGDDGNPTFLGACAEFYPVDKLLSCNSNQVENLLGQNLKQCLDLYEQIDAISKQCEDAVNSKDIKIIREVYTQIRPKVHIFGRKPECNDKFGSSD